MLLETIERLFELQLDKTTTITLEDIDPNISVENVLEHYLQLYPQLTTAKIIDKGIIKDKHVFEFQTIAGTKG